MYEEDGSEKEAIVILFKRASACNGGGPDKRLEPLIRWT